MNTTEQTGCEEWLLLRVGSLPRNSLGWFRCGVGFYNKKEFTKAIQCFEKSVQLDPLNYNAYQIMARACIAVNRKDDAINALKQSVALDNPSDWSEMYHKQMAVPDFMQREAPPNYVAGLGRGATGFVTRSDVGGLDEQPNEGIEDDKGLFAKPVDQEDIEADKIYEQVEKNMQERRRKWREERELEELEKYRKERPTFQEQFADLKTGLAQVSYDEWANLPDVQDMVRKRGQKKQKEEVYSRFNAVPESILLTNVSQQQMDSTLDDGKTDFVQFSQARDKLLGMKLDQLSGSSGAAVDPTHYLTDMANTAQKTDAEIQDIKKARVLLKSVINTNPHHAPGWIAAARLEEVDGKLSAARDLINRGCEQCPTSEDVWLDAARLNKPDQAKIILANAIKHIPQSVSIWLKAKELEQDVVAQKKVLRKALEHIPTSAKLWKVAISLEEDSEDARILLGRAVECVPNAIELWLALARLDSDLKNAQAILNKALKMNPKSFEIWLAAAKLQEQHNLNDKVHGIIMNAVKKLGQVGVHLEREEWLKEAEQCEKEGFLAVCQAVVENTIGLNLEEEDMKPTWFEAANECVGRGSIQTARFIFGHAIKTFPDKKSIWRRAAFFEKEHGTQQQLFDILDRAVQENPMNQVLWLLWAKELWINGDVEGARGILRKAFDANPDSEQIWLAAIKLEMETLQYPRAQELLSEARKRANTARVWMKSVVLERILKRFDQAFDMVTKAISLFPTFEKLYIIKGQILQYDLKDVEKARLHYQSSVKLVPKSAVLWTLASRLEETQGLFVKSRAILERARVVNPKVPELWLEAVLVEKRAGNASMVKALLSKAIQECPTSGLLWRELILNEVRPQRKARSMDALKKCENDPYVLCTIARLFWQERKLDKAKSWFERAVKSNPDIGDAWAWRYRFECEQGSPEGQTSVVQACIKQEPRHGILWCNVSKDLQNAGKGTKDILLMVSKQLSPTLS